MKRFLMWSSVLLSGVLTALPMLVPALAPLAWVSMVPLFLMANHTRHAYPAGLLWGAGYYGVLYYWFTCLYPMEFAGFTPGEAVGVIALAWIGISLLQSLEAAFVPFLFRRLRLRTKWLSPITAASLWVLLEWRQTQHWTGLPWGRLALTQYGTPAAIQSASLFGSLFISFLIVAVNALLALAIEEYRPRTGRAGCTVTAYAAGAAALLVLFNYIYGSAALAADKEEGERIEVALIQGNIASGDKWQDGAAVQALELYCNMTKEACAEGDVKVVLWPETVITSYLTRDNVTADRLAALSAETGAILLVGAYSSETDTDGEYRTYNSIYCFTPDGGMNDSIYSKRHLVPFGEYMPDEALFTALLPGLEKLNLFSGTLSAGTSASIMETPLGNIGALVCFDSIYETLTLSSVREGAELIALSTNDSWYLDSASVYQHNGHAVLRAVESGRYIIRAANTGISSVISPQGRITASLEPLQRGFVRGTVEFSDSRTLYSRIGNIIIVISALYTLTAAAFAVAGAVQKKKTQPHGVGQDNRSGGDNSNDIK